MEANELRIGNTITHQNNNGIYLVTVLETLKNGVNVKTNLQLGEWFLRYEEVEGTPLTEEWLLKFGFNKRDGKYEISACKSFLFLRRSYMGGFYYGINSSDCSFCEFDDVIAIKHVHQLQNLYFALTGKELACI
jgi:hypothetical protein